MQGRSQLTISSLDQNSENSTFFVVSDDFFQSEKKGALLAVQTSPSVVRRAVENWGLGVFPI